MHVSNTIPSMLSSMFPSEIMSHFTKILPQSHLKYPMSKGGQLPFQLFIVINNKGHVVAWVLEYKMSIVPLLLGYCILGI